MNILIAPKIMIAIFKLKSMNLASLIKTPPPWSKKKINSNNYLENTKIKMK